MEYIRGKTSAEIDADGLAARVAGYDDVLIDVGTDDGRYVLHVGRTQPTCFAIGVDACWDNLRRTSRKAPPNVLYVIANALALPAELGGMASKVTINFPWGSLLTGLVNGEPMLLEGLLAITRAGAALEVRLNGGALAESGYTLETGTARVRRALQEGGFHVGELLWLDARELRQCHTTWAKRLASGRDPRAVHLRGMLGYNGSIPGPTLRVEQGSEVTVDFTNETDLETTVHWHGLRLDNRFDGVSEGAPHHGMQPPITPAGSFSYRLRFPDPGVYWYHQHRSVK